MSLPVFLSTGRASSVSQGMNWYTPAPHEPCVPSSALELGVQGVTLNRERSSTASQCEQGCSFPELIYLGFECPGLNLTLYTRSNRNIQKACSWAAIEEYPQPTACFVVEAGQAMLDCFLVPPGGPGDWQRFIILFLLFLLCNFCSCCGGVM